ncbi:hypothetical protein [Kordia sp. SMS9]|uniref:hypothetical protein n=1 Tax=Kordia sp. SMS9 TaxID=2282170 RepID=UPI0013B4703E|nr:hypothetical protein [Kordia sp. SMS9]
MVDTQKSLYEIAKEKLEHQRESEFHYGARGQIEKIGRIDTTNTQNQHSGDERLKRQKKDKEHFEHILLLERLREELDNILERMDAIMHEMRDQMRKIRRGLKALERDDAALMMAFLIEEYPDEYDRETLQKMTFKEVERAVKEEVLTAEEQYQMFKNEYKALAEKYDQKIKDNPALKDKLTEEFAEREQQIQTEVEALDRSFADIRDEIGYALGKNNETSKNTYSQKHQIENQGFTDDEFFAGAPDLTAEFDKAASGSTVEREHELTARPPQNAPPPQTMKP